MQFKSPRHASKKASFLSLVLAVLAFSFFAGSASNVFSDPGIPVGYRGSLNALDGQQVRHMAIRSDGRYLFFSPGGTANFNVVDLLDMSHLGTATTVDGPVVGLAMDGTKRLMVATTASIEYFDVSSPFSINRESQKYSKPTSVTTTPIDACFIGQQVYLLETGASSSDHLIRAVTGITQSGSVPWTSSSLFSGSVTPLAIRCLGQQVIAFGNNTSTGSETEFWVGSLSASLGPQGKVNFSANMTNYARGDYIVSQDPANPMVLVMYNNSVPGHAPSSSDAKAVVANAASLNTQVVQLGTTGRAMLNYFDGTSSFFGFFLGQDSLNGATTAAEVFLSSPAATGPFSVPRGAGYANAGATIPSVFLSTTADHYKYMITDSGNVSLLSSAPTLQFQQGTTSAGQTLTSAQPLTFTLVSDPNISVDYEIHFDDSADPKGTSSAILTTIGRILKTGTIPAGQPQQVQISYGDLSLQKSGTYGLFIFGKNTAAGGGALVARNGLQFNFNPPPGPVKNFHLDYGDSSVYVEFDSPGQGGTPAQYNIWFGSDTNSLSAAQTIQGATPDYVLSSPVQIPAGSFSGSYVIHPVQNYQPLCVRVEAVDSLGQVSGNNPAPLCITPLRTRTLAEALGSPDSCSLGIPSNSMLYSYLFLTLGFACCIVSMRRRKKL